jgi:hypothetical protein
MTFAWFNIVGLALDIVGVWLVYVFAIATLAGGGGALRWKERDARREARQKFWGRVGMGLVTLGFLLQAVPSGWALVS